MPRLRINSNTNYQPITAQSFTWAGAVQTVKWAGASDTAKWGGGLSSYNLSVPRLRIKRI